MAALIADLSTRGQRACMRSLQLTISDDNLEAVLVGNGSDAARLPAERQGRLDLLTDLLDNLDAAQIADTEAQQPFVQYDFNVNAGENLSPEILRDYVGHWPTATIQWDNRDRTQEMRPYLYPANFMADRRQQGIPDISVGPWAALIKGSAGGAAVIKSDKLAATTQKAIEDSFRPYFTVVNKLVEAEQTGSQVTPDLLDDLFMVGKSIANASALCELNRTRQMLSILKPGAEDLYSNSDKQPLMQAEGIATLQQMRDTEKLATKLGVASSKPAQPKGRGQNSRQRSSAAPAGGQSNQGANKGAGRAKGGYKGGRARGRGGRN